MKQLDKRTINRFAWLPTLLDDGNYVWLVFYKVDQFFGIKNSYNSMMAHPRLSKNYWVDCKTYTKK